MQDLNDKITGDVLTAAEFVEIPSEIQNVIEGLGITLSSGDLNQLGKAIAGYVANGTFYTDSGIPDAYVLSVVGSKQRAPTYTNGFTIRFVVGNTNAGASTVNVAGLGVKSIKLAGSVAIPAGELVVGTTAELVFDGTDFILKQKVSSKAFSFFADALAFDSSFEVSIKYITTEGFLTRGVGSAEYVRTGLTGTASTGDPDDFFDAGGVGWTRVDKLTRSGSFSVVVDTTDEFVRDTVLPILTTRGFAAALAVPLASLHSSYVRMTLTDLHDYIRANDGEILSHAINGIVLDNTVQTSYGESSIRTSKFELVKYGFRANAFVAINSVLDSKFLPELKKWYDYAYIRSVDGSVPSNSVNGPESDVYNLTRVGLESGTLQQMKDVADFAKSTFQNVVYFTHADTVNLADTLDHAILIGLAFELPSTWMARIHGLKKPMVPPMSENLASNTDFIKEDSTDLSPIKWSLTSSTMTGLSSPVTASEVGSIDIIGTAAAADERLLFTQIFNSGDILDYTAFCFAINATSIDLTNTVVRITLSARDAGSSVLTQSVRDFTIRGGRQRIFSELGVIPGGTAVSFIQAVVELISIAAGQVRAICDSPALNRSWTPYAFEKSPIEQSFLKIRNNAATSVAGGVQQILIFDAPLVGSVVGTGYDDTTGKWKNSDNRKIDIKVHAGFQNMNASERLNIQLFKDNVGQEQVNLSTNEGATDVVGLLSATIVNDGGVYDIRISHDSVGNRNLTVGLDSMLSIISFG